MNSPADVYNEGMALADAINKRFEDIQEAIMRVLRTSMDGDKQLAEAIGQVAECICKLADRIAVLEAKEAEQC